MKATKTGILWNSLADTPVYQAVEDPYPEPIQPGLALAMCFSGVHHIVAAIEPMAHELFDQLPACAHRVIATSCTD
jgi:hypothetical protein